ncbi:hypothetical protein KTT_22800 [Tengunoibacter tsumagoiensis]|uniref:Uncharacterized protein n=1 Tax=Tengunoibacter tsumagoiensis TaxID=2014871 RepID=A0A402A080_9CHLR|nr:hypothetical protein KTT_22800 [Tengunoibacter tsumagoiensis]
MIRNRQIELLLAILTFKPSPLLWQFRSNLIHQEQGVIHTTILKNVEADASCKKHWTVSLKMLKH